jgi:DnaJ-class molecular chaperone
MKKKRISPPVEYGFVICPSCYGCGYIYNPNHQVCTSCKGFGRTRMEAEKDTNISPRNDQLTNITSDAGS